MSFLKRHALALVAVAAVCVLAVLRAQPSLLPPGAPAIEQVDALAAAEYAAEPIGGLTIGVARGPAGPADHSVGPVSGWEQKVLAALPQTTYQYEPGTRYLYSNIGFASLGIALSRAAREPYTSYVEQHILAPLGMTHTAFEPT